MNYTLDFPIQYIANPDRFATIGLGELYIGVVDGDPAAEPADRIQAYIARQNDTDLAIPQPIELSAGGVPVYLGSPVTLKTDQVFSVAVLDRNGVQIYYSPKSGEIIEELANLAAEIAAIAADVADAVQSVPTIEDLIAYTGMVDGQQISVQSFWGGWSAAIPYIGPRGGGVFGYNASTPKSNHNGITVISPTVSTISSQSGAGNGNKAANWINGVGETDPSGNGCWERIYEGEWVASWGGAYLDGVTNSQPQLQAWLDKAYNTAPLPSLYFEDGTYNIEGQGLKWDSAQNPAKRYRIKLRGANRNSTLLINAGAPYAGAVFDFGGDAVANLKYESSISDIQFVGTGADYALSANYASYIDMTNVSCVGAAAIAGFANSGTFGSTYTNCLFKSALDGYLSTTISGSFNNATTFTSCSFWQNGRAGCNIGGSFKTLKFDNCIFEQNAHVGAILGPGESASFDTCYFELNATTGWTFTSPSINVKCDIIFGTGGSYMTSIANTADVSTGVVTLSETQGTLDCFIFAPGCSNLSITNNEKRQGQAAIPLVRTYGNTTESPGDSSAVAKWTISDNKNLVEEVQFLNNTVPMRADGAVRDIRIKSKNAGYYTTPNLEQFSVGAGGIATVWSRSSRKLPDDPLVPVWDLSTVGSGTSDYRIFTADADYMTKYNGKLMVFGAWVYTPFTNDGAARMIVQNVLTQSSNDSSPGWLWKGYIFTCNSAATARFGIAKSGSTGVISICKPTLCELGAFVSDRAGEVRKDFYGSAAPTTGTWQVGDRVWKTNPTSGTSPGWVCTNAAGSGTWVAMANLA